MTEQAQSSTSRDWCIKDFWLMDWSVTFAPVGPVHGRPYVLHEMLLTVPIL